MQTQINIDNYPKQKEEIIKILKKKVEKKGEKFDESQIQYSYCYGITIGGPEYADFNEHLKHTVSGSYQGRYGRLIHACDGDIPQEVVEIFKDNFDKKKEEETLKQKKEAFLSEILTKVGKTPTFNNQVKSPAVMRGDEFFKFMMNRYPTIDELKQVKPDVYENYTKIANGQLVCFHPVHEKADEFGFLVQPIKGMYRKEAGDSTMIVCEDDIQVFELFDNEPDTVYWKFNQDHRPTTTKFHSATPGSNFIGSHNGKYRRLDTSEVDSISSKIYKQDTDIQRRTKQPDIYNHGNGLFQINM